MKKLIKLLILVLMFSVFMAGCSSEPRSEPEKPVPEEPKTYILPDFPNSEDIQKIMLSKNTPDTYVEYDENLEGTDYRVQKWTYYFTPERLLDVYFYNDNVHGFKINLTILLKYADGDEYSQRVTIYIFYHEDTYSYLYDNEDLRPTHDWFLW